MGLCNWRGRDLSCASGGSQNGREGWWKNRRWRRSLKLLQSPRRVIRGDERCCEVVEPFVRGRRLGWGIPVSLRYAPASLHPPSQTSEKQQTQLTTRGHFHPSY